jgi:hypothetical protein
MDNVIVQLTNLFVLLGTLGLMVRLFGILASLLPTSKALELAVRVLDMLSIPIAPLGRH